MIRTAILLISLTILALAGQVDAEVFTEPFDAYVPGSGFTAHEPGESDFQYVTADGLSGGDRVASMSDGLGGTGVLEIVSQGGGDNVLRATPDTGFAQTFGAQEHGHVGAIDVPGLVPPFGGPLASPLDLTGNSFSVSARHTAGPPVEIRWFLMSTTVHEVLGSTRFQLTSSFQVFEVSLSEFADDPDFGSFDVSVVEAVAWDIFLQSHQNDNVTTPIVIEIDDVASMPEPALVGDLNDDGFVGQSDLDIVLAMWGNSGIDITDPRADVNEDDFVGQTDLDFILADWGLGTPPEAPVPEPATLLLLVFGGLALVRRHRQ